ncbi:iron uptake system protein EfeO [Viridibacillus sp. FSL R5-0477]|uniref:Lipoprotein n=1 Tax=Viridibacillus arenosi FSL R5-213 TaxID=1227360 RepID=W4EQT4_9BACL|nr:MULTISPECIES: iron uptake system protein EfeO [Viridibacillus]ETT82928.1 lipoprotein [Viridibacillus arenosi FSL R5-213]OMC82125.1 Efem/EfeO family lipoprotein [Viridibacillus sp. FSL H8-0123]OMC86282.1 Efem/EfeO family lipoprotein [Viridibacillus sp. FSL H7-0596]OMC90814.1 Efem/EfeO family lipoprotein [Viridibacillus arenosi]
MKSKSLLAILLAGSVIVTGCNNSDKESSVKNSSTEATKDTKVIDLQAEIDAYKEFALDQMDQFTTETEKFVTAVKAGDIDKAKDIYPNARMFFERSEPIAESFGDLDPRIDARLADLEEEGQGKEDWSGYHKIEYGLWEENTTKGYEKTADQLLKDAKELRARVETVEVTPDLMMTGAIDLLNEVSTSKISGEEEIFSHTDLYDFKANVEGAEKIFTILESKIEAKDPELAKNLTKKFKTVNDLLAKHETKDGYVSYTELTKDDTKALAEAVNNLGEPLSQMAIIME